MVFHKRFFSSNHYSIVSSGNPLLTTLKVLGFLGGSTLFLAYASDSRALIHPLVTMPLLHQLDPETSHKLSIWLAKHGIAPRETHPEPARLQISVCDW
jgi:hypothetical protein